MGAPEHRQIVLVAPNLGDGGSQRVVTLLAEAWSRQGHSVCVVTLYDRPDFYRLPSHVKRVSLGGDGLHLFRLVIAFFQRLGYLLERLWPDAGPAWVTGLRRLMTTGTASVLAACGRAVRRLLGRKGLELLVRVAPSTRRRLRGLRSTVLGLEPSAVISFTGPTNVMSVLACRDLPTHLIVSERNDPSRQSLRFPWNDLRPHAYREADVVTANSRGAIERLREWVPDDRLRFVPNPLVVRNEGGSTPPTRDRPRMLIVGRLHAQKGHDVLLNALTLLPPDIGEWTLAVVGRGEQEALLRRLASDLGLSSRVEWLGQMADPDPYFRSSDLFVLPSRHEGMPNALLEAMSHALPPIVSDASPGPLEVVRHGETGLVVPVADAAALASAIALLVKAPDLRARLGAAARLEANKYDVTSALVAWDGAIARSASAPGRQPC